MTLQQAIVLAVQASILMTVFGFGLHATGAEVVYVVRHPSLLARSLVAMFVIMPIVALVLDRTFNFFPSVEIILIALALAPIPPLLPGRQQKSGGYEPYAVGLMVIVAVLSIVTVPASLNFLSRYFVRPLTMSPGAVARIMMMTVVVPLATGMAFRAILPAVASRIAKPVELVAKVLLASSGLAILAGTLPSVIALIGNGTLAAFIAFVAAGLAVGHWMGGPQEENRLVLALATASRHPALALAIATTNYPDEPNLGAAVILFLLVNLLVGIAYTVWHKRSHNAVMEHA